MWNTWNPSPQVAHAMPVDWAAKAAEWAAQQIVEPEYRDIVENEEEMEDAMPPHDTQHSNEWSAVTDHSSGQYSNTNWNGAEFEDHQDSQFYDGAEHGYDHYDNQVYPGTDPYHPPEPGFEQFSQVTPNVFPENHGFPERPPPPPMAPTPHVPHETTTRPHHLMRDTAHIRNPPPLGVPTPPRRKALPAWIRDGLEKMDKGKPGVAKEDLDTVDHVTVVQTKSNIQRNRISGYSVLNDSGGSSDEKGSDSEEEIVPKMDPALFVKRSLTELLLEVTGTELRSVVMECVHQEQAIQHLNNLCKKKETSGKNGLELVSYNDQSSDSSASEVTTAKKRRNTRSPDLENNRRDSYSLLKIDPNKENKTEPKLSESPPVREKKTASPESYHKSSKSSKHHEQEHERLNSRKSRSDQNSRSARSNRTSEGTEKHKSSRKSRSSVDDKTSRVSPKEESPKSTERTRSPSSDSDEKKSKSKSDRRRKHTSSKKKDEPVSKREEKTKKKDAKNEKHKKPKFSKKIDDLNRKIVKATKEVEQTSKTKSSRKRSQRSSSVSSSSPSPSPERRVKSRKPKKSSTSKSRKKKLDTSSSSSSDYGYKYSSSSSDRPKSRKR